MKRTYKISYTVHFTDRAPESRVTRVKNCDGEMHAKVKLDDYLKRKNATFDRLVVDSCEYDVSSIFDMLGIKNPLDDILNQY